MRRWRTTNVCDPWGVRRQTYGYLPSRNASAPIGWYQNMLVGDRSTCVKTCSGLHSTAGRLGFERAIYCSQVQHLIAMPPRHHPHKLQTNHDVVSRQCLALRYSRDSLCVLVLDFCVVLIIKSRLLKKIDKFVFCIVYCVCFVFLFYGVVLLMLRS